MKAYAALAAFVVIAVAGIGWSILRTDWTPPNYSADTDSSLTVRGLVLPCADLMARPCDRNDQRTLEQAQPQVEAFLAIPNLASLVTRGEITVERVTSFGVQICGDRFWSESSSVFADKHPDLSYSIAFVVWSSATQTLCATTAV